MAGCRGALCCCCRWCCCCGERESRTPEELTILGETQEEDDEILPRKDYESLDYDRCINDPYLEVLESMDNKKGRRYEVVKWIMVFAIGVSTGLVGLFVDFFVRLFTQLKFRVVETSVEECSEKGCLALSLLELLGFNLTFVFLASLLVLIEPVAAGSGIPEIKCYLNGVKVPGIVRLRTLACKVLGVLFSVAGGLFVGKEGPMIHSGAVVGAGLPQFTGLIVDHQKMNPPKRLWVFESVPTVHLVPNHQVTSEDVNSSIKTFFCPNETYNDMATLFFNPQESAILQLFHQDGTFSPITLALFFVLYFLLSCWTYGMSVPSGLFVPSLLCGAAFGRLVANILKSYIGLGHIYSGTFALIGAASFLGGVVRMTISLTVILIESTNEITYGLPIMITLMVAKWTGDFFNKGIYDIHVGLRGVPLLEWETEVEMDKLRASDIMEPNLTYVYPHTRIQSLVSILRTTVHHAFPVVTENRGNEKEFMKGNQLISNNIKFKKSSILTRAGEQRKRSQSMKSYPSSELRNMCDEHIATEEPAEKEDLLQQMLERRYTPYPNLYPDQSPSEDWTMEERFRPLTFHGLILRSQLVTLLVRGVCYSESQSSASQPRLSYAEMAEDYPRYPDIHDLDLTLLNPRMIVDVTPYMNPSPFTVSPNTHVSQVFNLFRTMGLRHLPVVNAVGEIVGIITRHNLTYEFLHGRLRQHYQTI
ncbi:chloride transport protein 6 [Gracilinanus agilis]|uniref:chloride transport protein 6 n=1 Tax=Gracilinanus agilis TaxID=191870 RepID=UPI001CFE982E|nr:chloride transport protein 6 [Gracilinanus agilis]